ncbi:unnamed protein product [Schistosoma margrebowiei]|uniref:Uncharacterized protein n=1 Tax=Schistosoma margrebowiei TaxID=48269 RepID=A0A183NBM6_9TREM|nr:unnamed protein product [Schistosoma margrebowiei]
MERKYSKPERLVKEKVGKPVTEIQGQRNGWMEHFEEVLNRPAPMNPPEMVAAPTDIPIDVTSSTNEVTMAINKIKSGIAAGPDNVLAEALKSDKEVTANMLHLLFREIWEDEQVPINSKEGHLNKTTKKGYLSKCENYRGITSL